MTGRFSDHAANERTFLAWVRTAIAIMGFGLAAARLGSQHVDVTTERLMLAAGGLVIVCAFVRMRHMRRYISKSGELGQEEMPADTLLLVLIASLVVLLGTFAVHVA
ncbi:YidH family protein [Phaeobacter marinintestinus]|uniref:YidH family protein n=1 Tax=Falsiphaeobacter marinintestinus TaxID=1492905 RepID=UPI0011B7FD0C|nr:DUF202 domain-containing protein [Phaeobacter marinintestinus]